MKVLKWTPWRYAGGGQISGADGKPLAWLAVRTQPVDAEFGNLIAAAPDLYEILQAAVHALRSNVATDLAEEIADAGDRVLAKARGETP